ncbi:MAG: FluC/FEX family fluoride channel [Rhodoglobus sp.]
MPWRDLLAVLAGGAVGTALRLGIDTLVPHADAAFPVSTLLINTGGAFALGLLVARVWPTARSWLRAGLGAGLLGSFTTFSALAVSLVSLTAAGFGMLAAAYLAATMVLGLAAAALGLRLGARTITPVDLVDE